MAMNWNDMNALQQLALEQALYKRIAADVSTKDRNNLRGRVDEEIKGFYEVSGAKSYDIRFGDAKVGTMSVTVSKEVPDKTHQAFEVTDEAALFHWYPSGDEAKLVDEFLYQHWREFAEFYFVQTGELPDGCEVVERVIPGTPSRVKGTTIRVDPAKVGQALGNSLPTAIAGLLGGVAE